MKRGLLYCFCFIFLGACNQYSEPLIQGEIVKLIIECESGETIEIVEQKTINKVLKDINQSRREGTQEMEFSIEHQVTLENSDGETESFYFFNGGKALVSGYYVHSNLEDFCEK
ncbi:hypothetical protein [Psychrobacillus lasiicapitis]|uniref:Uncharacterized protein n=1 Tax=Psychrobacillus lasiicapitis TaxID=1636719 RepID=A0A544SRH8_9BACI|nr:hypothetical protein [Psychrobacillus lasiicapitis]TQR07807.1 hypothetical protein FG382_22090 [Psychrobacillus lasiicapitis]GGA48843.1 hypothetical protein GCM10011384_43170 [Psychrobacillus lasiicapitis]